MNIDTGEVKNYDDLTEAEKASGKWFKLPKQYTPKTPITDADTARLIAAEVRRRERAQKRLRRHLGEE